MELLFVILVIISSILAGMGIGGGALFVILLTNMNKLPQKEAQVLNLILFIAVSISATYTNIKEKDIDFGIVKKIIIPLAIGAFIGTEIVKKINDENLKKYFSFFMLLIGIYEIISSLITSNKGNNNNDNE